MSRVPRWELVTALVALFILGRTPVLFFRLHTSGLFWPIAPLWQQDIVVTIVLGAAEVALIALAVRRGNTDVLLEQPFLLAFLGFVWLSIAWSVEPAVSTHRALLMVGTVGAGWYIGDRFSIRDQIRLVTWLGWIATGTTVFALLAYNTLARSTNGRVGAWSGVYVNRNSLALVLALGVLGSWFFVRTTDRTAWIRVVRAVMLILIVFTGSRTGLIGLAVAFASASTVFLLRRRRGASIKTPAAAYVVFATLATGGLFVHLYWMRILDRLGRRSDLTGRTTVWDLVRWFSHLHPWRGWGFEAIWANVHAMAQAQATRSSSITVASGRGIPGGWPFAAHNGYYEVMLGVGFLGLALFVVFLGTALWRAFQHAWYGRDSLSLWPLSVLVFAIVVNFAESLFISGEALMVLTVAVAVTVAPSARRRMPPNGSSSAGEVAVADTA